jgi:DHA1 family tetracycline resistance protein-like MFS transporter
MKTSLGTNQMLTIFLVVFVDLLGFSLILPLLPYYAEAYGANALVTGLLVASYAAAQLVGAPILGRLSDEHGRRPILLVSIAGTILGFVLLGVAEPLGNWFGAALGASIVVVDVVVLVLLFTSRILDGLTGGNISVAQAYISDITTPENRARGLGLIGAAFGLGFIIGPVVGGLLSGIGFWVPAAAAAVIATANWFAVYFFLPESLTAEKRAELAQHGSRPRFSLDQLMTELRRPRVGPLFHIRFFFGLAFSLFQSIFAIYAAGGPLNLTPQQTGLVLTYVGVLAVIVQGFAIGRLAKRYSDKQLMLVSAILMAIGLFLWGLVPNVWTLLIVLAPLSFGGGVLNTIINTALSKVVYPEDIGGTLGISASIESLTRVIAPVIGGALLMWFGPWGPALFTGVVMIYVAWFVYRRLFQRPDPPLEPRQGQPYPAQVGGSASGH